MKGRPKVLLANETGHTSNPGCRAVRRAYDRLFALTGATSAGTLPLGIWSSEFEALAPAKKDRVDRVDGGFSTGTTDAPPLDLDEWRRIRDRLVREDLDFAEAILGATLLVVNGEGTLHHNLPRALALFALMSAAIDLGKPVALMNSTIQAMDHRLVAEVFPRLGLLHAREMRTFADAAPLTPGAFVAPDIAALSINAIEAPFRSKSDAEGRTCLLTAGVLVNGRLLQEVIRIVRDRGFDPIYLSIGDGRETEIVTKLCRKARVPVVAAGEITLEHLVETISRSAMVISGRHHINLFVMRCGVPLIPLPSNTWKIEGTLALCGYPGQVAGTLEGLATAIEATSQDRVALAEASREAFRCAADLAAEIPRRFGEWS